MVVMKAKKKVLSDEVVNGFVDHSKSVNEVYRRIEIMNKKKDKNVKKEEVVIVPVFEAKKEKFNLWKFLGIDKSDKEE